MYKWSHPHPPPQKCDYVIFEQPEDVRLEVETVKVHLDLDLVSLMAMRLLNTALLFFFLTIPLFKSVFVHTARIIPHMTVNQLTVLYNWLKKTCRDWARPSEHCKLCR